MKETRKALGRAHVATNDKAIPNRTFHVHGAVGAVTQQRRSFPLTTYCDSPAYVKQYERTPRVRN